MLNEYLNIIKIPFPDKGFYYDIDKAEKCVLIADEFAIRFGEYLDSLFAEQMTNITIKELLEIYKKEKGL